MSHSRDDRVPPELLAANLLLRDERRISRKPVDPDDLARCRLKAETFRNVPLITEFPQELPVARESGPIIQAIQNSQVLIVCGDTGSGKTTQLPKMMLQAGCGQRGRIGITQPRRLAAVSMAKRVAEECGCELGEGVGMQVRFDERVSDASRIKFMTDGVLLAELHSDRDWLQYDALMIDEAHERSLNIDFLLGCIKRLIPRRPDLKVVISSATLDAERFSRFFDGAPVLEVEGRLFPIEDQYLPPGRDDMELADQVGDALRELDRTHGELDTLVFLPGEREILDAQKRLTGQYAGRAEIIPMYARLSLGEQQKAFKVGDRRRIILATNVAETSITLPAIRAVIDSGWVRMKRYHPQTQVERLQTERVSLASAKQRRGRCGRTGPGVCVRLYPEDWAETAPAYSDPEILRSSLADVILRMAIQRLPPVQDFPFIDPPKGSLINEGYRSLYEIGAMTRERKLTKAGREIAGFAVEPRLARMLMEGKKEQVLESMLVLVAYLSIQDPRVRPRDRQEAADEAHRRWRDEQSDFLTVLNMWNDLISSRSGGKGRGAQFKFCRAQFLHAQRSQEWLNLVEELRRSAGEKKWKVPRRILELDLADPDGIHRSLLAGLPTRVGERGDDRLYRDAKGTRFQAFPGSALFGKPPRWIMCFTLMETQKLYARDNARIRPEWVAEIAPHLCKHVVENPCWNEARGFVEASERVVLGNLTLIPPRQIHYGRVDPVKARAIFIVDGLATGAMKIRHPSWRKYLKFRKSLGNWEHKLRRPGFFTDVARLEAHFEKVVPDDVCSVRDFDRWCDGSNPDWVPSAQTFLGDEADAASYPDRLDAGDLSLNIRYGFQPDEPEQDGLWLQVREADLASFPESALEWTIPAWLPEKVRLILRTLPKNMRNACQPHQQTANDFLEWMRRENFGPEHSLYEALAAFLRVKLDTILAVPDFDLERLPAHLQTKLRVVDESGATRYHGATVPGKGAMPEKRGRKRVSNDPWTQERCNGFPGTGLPASAEWQGRTVYPALTAGPGVALFPNREEARWSAWEGVVALLEQQRPDLMKLLQKGLPLSTGIQLELASLKSDGVDGLGELVHGVIYDVIGSPETADAFDASLAGAEAKLLSVADTRMTQFHQVMLARSRVLDLRGYADWIPPDLVADLDGEWSLLFELGWMRREFVWERLPRHLAAIEARLKRMKNDVFKDRKKLQSFREDETRILARLQGRSAPIRHAGINRLQEIRLVTFAPELRPHERMSVKRVLQWVETL